MDILGSIFAYLGCMAGIVGAMLISFTVFFSAPDKTSEQTLPKQPAATTAQAAVRKTATTSAGKSTAAITQHAREHEAASTIAPRTEPRIEPRTEPKPDAASARSRMLAARAQKWRRYVQEDRARRWAYQQDPDFATRFLGYAD